MKKVSKKLVLSILLALLSLSTLFLFAGCQSTDKTNAYIGNDTSINVTYQYNAETDETSIRWKTSIQNDTIYNIKQVIIRVDLYNGDTLVKRDAEYTFSSVSVRAGQTKDGTFLFQEKGKVTKLVFNEWSAIYSTFWETYQIWIYITLGVAALLAFIYIIVMIVNDLELWETWDNIKDFFEEYIFVFWIFVIAGGSAIIASLLASYWVQLLIILGGIVATIVLGLIAHLIKHFIDERKYNGDPTPVEEEIEEYNAFGVKKRVVHRKYGKSNHVENDNNEEDENDEDIETFLYSQTLQELREICREEGITGFTTLNKEETIELILEHLQENHEK